MYVKRRSKAGESDRFEVVEAYRDPADRNRAKERTLIKLGHHPTALAAYRAALADRERLSREHQKLIRTGGASITVAFAPGGVFDQIDQARLAEKDLERYAVIEVAKEVLGPGRDAANVQADALSIGVDPAKVEVIRLRPYLWDRFVKRQLSYKEAVALAAKLPARAEKAWLAGNR